MTQFPPIEDILATAKDERERVFLQREYGYPLDYFLLRLDRIKFGGGRILDAGCGAGQWSIALSHRFERVDAVDIREDRLATLRYVKGACGASNINVSVDSIEALSFDDRCFDAVLCYGVIMFTNVKKSLSEFKRVLKPNGKLFVCLNSDEFYLQWIQNERAKKDPEYRKMGMDALYATYWRRAIESGLKAQLTVCMAQNYQNIPAKLFQKIYVRGKRIFASLVGAKPMWRKRVDSNPHYQTLLKKVAENLDERYISSMYKDAFVLDKITLHSIIGAGCAYTPDEINNILNHIGFVEFQYAPRERLNVCDDSSAISEDISVWEFFCQTPSN